VPRHYLWDTTGPVPQIVDAKNSGATWFRSTWGNQRIAYKNGSAAPQWFQYDARGSVIRTDPTNTDVVVGPTAYSPTGSTGTTSGADRIGYRGELTSSNLINLRARNYDPETSQFTSQDPLDGVNGTPGVANPYQYADNDPLNRVDPLGLRVSDDGITAGQAGAACSAVGGHLAYWGSTGSRVCIEPPMTRAEGGSCFPLRSPGNHSIVFHSGSCGTWSVTTGCDRYLAPGPLNEWAQDQICDHHVGVTQVLAVIGLGALAAAGGAAAIVAIGGSAGIAIPFGGGGAVLAEGGVLGGGAIVLSPTAVAQLASGGTILAAANHLMSDHGDLRSGEGDRDIESDEVRAHADEIYYQEDAPGEVRTVYVEHISADTSNVAIYDTATDKLITVISMPPSDVASRVASGRWFIP
jgi:RHS repeat-associated protein